MDMIVLGCSKPINNKKTPNQHRFQYIYHVYYNSIAFLVINVAMLIRYWLQLR